MVKNLPERQETSVRSLGWEDPLQKGMATHCSILAWRIPWTEKPGGDSPRGCRESDTTEPLSLSSLRMGTVSCSSGCHRPSPCSTAQRQILLRMQTISFQIEMISWTNQTTKNKCGM